MQLLLRFFSLVRKEFVDQTDSEKVVAEASACTFGSLLVLDVLAPPKFKTIIWSNRIIFHNLFW